MALGANIISETESRPLPKIIVLVFYFVFTDSDQHLG